MTLTKTAASTVRLNVWFRPDLRGGDKPMPHNHPWTSFTGHVLLGGYDEDRYRTKQEELHQIQHSSP